MNIREAIVVDRLQDELQAVREELSKYQAEAARQLSYIRQLEAAVVAVPLYREGMAARYFQRVTEWVDRHRWVLEEAHRDPEVERRKLQVRINSKVALVRDRVDSWVKRAALGDTSVPKNIGAKLWEVLSKELATI